MRVGTVSLISEAQQSPGSVFGAEHGLLGKLLILGKESAAVELANVNQNVKSIQLSFKGHSAPSQWGILRGDLKRFYSFFFM